jgi:hypothetical protein
MKCSICNQEVNEKTKSFRVHLLKIHELTLEQYYRLYIIKPNEGKCNNENCNNITHFLSISKGYRLYCSVSCRNKCEKMKSIIEQTNLKKYGCKCASQSKEIRERIKNINLKKYGVTSTLKLKEIQEKIKQTNIKKYGVPNPMQSEIVKNKSKETSIKKYGYKYPSQSKEVQNKIVKTNLNKYGVKYGVQSEIVKNKIKETTIEKYGVTNILKFKGTRDKIESTNLKRYGVKNPFQNEACKQKIKETNLKKYGTEHASQTKEFQEKLKNTRLERYGVKYSLQAKECQEKLKKTNMKRYGVETPLLLPEFQDKMRRSYRDKYWDIFIIKMKNKKIIPLFNKDQYIKNENFEFKCLRCGKVFKKQSTNPVRISCGCLKSRSKHEDEIIDWLKDLSFKNIKNNEMFFENGVKKFEIDVYLPDLNFGIEFHGLVWHHDGEKSKDYHQQKYIYFKNKNIKLIQIFQNEWINKSDIVKSIIKLKLNILKNKIYGRKCILKELNNREYEIFLEENHLQGYVPSKIKVGLYYKDELIYVMGLGKSRFNKKYDWEIVRLCSKLDYIVIGGFPKLLKYIVKKYDIKKIISYSDLRYFEGASYLNNGFTYNKITSPNYFYFKNKTMELYNRMKFQKHKLKKILPKFDPNKSEYENMINNDYLRIFDAGNNVFIKEYNF